MKKLLKTLGHALGLSLLLAASPAGADVVTITGSITASTTWFATNTYHLVGKVYVHDGANLTIEPGTIIKGTNDTTLFGSLFICQGAKIFAQGTPDRPIIFTSTADNLGTAGAWPNLGIYDRGLWGGIVLLGRASLNSSADATGNGATPIYGVYEGLPDIVINGQNVHRYGGSNDADSSGVMRYVSIRHGGKRLESNKEINGLSFCGVGSSSVMEFIEAYAIADDGFEFFGGNVNTRYLVSAFNDDDAFDTDEGYRGLNQFWFGIQEHGAKDSGFEIDGDQLNTGTAPTSEWKLWNATLLGSGAANGQQAGNAFTIREFSAPSFFNGIFGDFARRGVSIDANAGTHNASGKLDIANNIFFGFGTSDTVTNIGITANAQAFLSDPAKTNLIVNPQLAGISRINDGGLDPRPLPGSPALNIANVKPVAPGGFITPTDYLGAFAGVNWASTWTALGGYGILTTNGAGQPVSVAPPVIDATAFRNALPGASVATGGTLTLTVPPGALHGTGPFTYQWFRNGSLLPGATNATLSLPGFNAASAGNYTVQVGNAGGSVTSANIPVSTADIAFFGGVTIDGPANAKYRIEFLADIANTNSWTSLTNIVHPGGRQFYIDTTSDGRARRFFRAVPTP
jgi:hypothetical protein